MANKLVAPTPGQELADRLRAVHGSDYSRPRRKKSVHGLVRINLYVPAELADWAERELGYGRLSEGIRNALRIARDTVNRRSES